MTSEKDVGALITRILKATEGKQASLEIKIDVLFNLMMTCLYVMTDPDAPTDIREATSITYLNLKQYLLIIVPSVFDDLKQMEQDLGVITAKI